MPIPTSERMLIGSNARMTRCFFIVVKIFYRGWVIRLMQFSKKGNMVDEGEPNLWPAALVSLLVAEHVSSPVRFVLVLIFHEELSYLLHA